MLGFIVAVIACYCVVGFFVFIGHVPTYSNDKEGTDKAISYGMFWFIYMIRGIYRAVARSLLILFKS